MLREELIKNLNTLVVLNNLYIIPRNNYEVIKLQLPKTEKNGSVENDPFLKEYFDYFSSNDKKLSTYIRDFSFYISANIDLGAATEEQMSEMMGICGYNAEDMNRYAMEDINRKAACIPEAQLLKTVCILSRALSDAMGDASVWQCYKNGRKKQNYTPAPNRSLQKLKDLVAYMEAQDLIVLDTDCGVDYVDFVTNSARHVCVSFSPVKQREKILRDVEEQLDKLLRKIKAADKVMGNRKGKTDEISTIDSNKLYNRMCLYKEREQLLEEERILEEELLNLVFKPYLAVREEIMRNDNGCNKVNIAKGMFSAILTDRDDIYRLKIGSEVMLSFVELCKMVYPEEMAEEMLQKAENINADEGMILNYKNMISISRETSPSIMLSYPKAKAPVIEDVQEVKGASRPVPSTTVRRLEQALRENISEIQRLRDLQEKFGGAEDLLLGNASLTVEETMEELLEKCRTDGKLESECSRIERKNRKLLYNIDEILNKGEESRKKRKNNPDKMNKPKFDSAPPKAKKEEFAVNIDDYDALFPYRTPFRITLCGGSKYFRDKIETILPGIRVPEDPECDNIYFYINSDIVIFETTHMSHKLFKAVYKACKKRGISIIQMNGDSKSNRIKLLEDIKKEEEKLSGRLQSK